MSQQQSAQHQRQAIQARISAAEATYNRDAGSVTLIGASKTKSPAMVTDFAKAGMTEFGENYLQEAQIKIEALESLNLSWHFIGQIQSNKTKTIARLFDWVHGVDRLKIARRLAEQNLKSNPIKLLIQLNLDNEPSKGGVAIEQAAELAEQTVQLLSQDHKAELKGFMAIPKACDNQQDQRATFAKARELMSLTNQRYGLRLDQLSMGMSGDLEAAIAEGATMVRVGTDLFGARK